MQRQHVEVWGAKSGKRHVAFSSSQRKSSKMTQYMEMQNPPHTEMICKKKKQHKKGRKEKKLGKQIKTAAGKRKERLEVGEEVLSGIRNDVCRNVRRRRVTAWNSISCWCHQDWHIMPVLLMELSILSSTFSLAFSHILSLLLLHLHLTSSRTLLSHLLTVTTVWCKKKAWKNERRREKKRGFFSIACFFILIRIVVQNENDCKRCSFLIKSGEERCLEGYSLSQSGRS